MRVVLTEAAEEDLDDVLWSGTERFGFAAAADYVRSLRAGFETLSTFPDSSPASPTRPEIRVRRFRSHVLLYRADHGASTVVVLRIRHGRENWLQQLQPQD